MQRKDIITAVKNICIDRYQQIEDWNHNINHIKRVVKYATKIAEAEKLRSKDVFLVELAAWMHDLGRLGEEKGIGFVKAKHAEKSYRQARNILKKYGRFIGREDVVKVLQAVREHSNALLDHPRNVVARCLQDGDRGASLNAIGLVSMLDYTKVIEDVGPVVTIKEAEKKKEEILNKIKERGLKDQALEKLKDLRMFYTGENNKDGSWRLAALHCESAKKMFKKGFKEIDEFIDEIEKIK